MAAAVTTDEIYKRYLDKAIKEILRLEHEVAAAAEGAPVAQPTGHPLGTIFLLKFALTRASLASESRAGASGEDARTTLESIRFGAIPSNSPAREDALKCQIGGKDTARRCLRESRSFQEIHR